MANTKAEKNAGHYSWKILQIVTEKNCHSFFCICIFDSENRVKCHNLIKYTFYTIILSEIKETACSSSVKQTLEETKWLPCLLYVLPTVLQINVLKTAGQNGLQVFSMSVNINIGLQIKQLAVLRTLRMIAALHRRKRCFVWPPRHLLCGLAQTQSLDLWHQVQGQLELCVFITGG